MIFALLMPQFDDSHKANAITYVHSGLLNANQKNFASTQGLTGKVSPVTCSSPMKQQSILKISTIIQDTDHFVKVPLNTLMFRVSIQSNGVAESFRLGLSNPLTICVYPGHFTVTETSLPSEYIFGATIYSLDSTTANTSTNTPCSANISEGNSLTCTITNTITGITTPIKVINSTIANVTTLSVIGTASTNVKPDTVTLSLGVETTNKTATGAIVANSKLMNRVLEALKSGGVMDNETGTSSFTIAPIYSQISGNRENITGFKATNFVAVHSYNINNVSMWIDTSIKAGANSVNGISFRLSDKKLSDIKNSLTNNAIDDAIDKANSTTSKLGLRILGIKSIALDSFEPALGSPQTIQAQGLPTTLSVSGGMNSPIILGQQQISEKVRIVFLSGK